MDDTDPDRLNTWLLFLLTFSLSWAAWALAALLGARNNALLAQILHYAGGLGPLAVMLALLYRRHTPVFRRGFWHRAIDFKLIGIKWYAVILLTVPALTALGALADKLLGGIGLQMETAGRFVQQP